MTNVAKNFICGLVKNRLVVQQIRFYPRWAHRRPVKVYSAEEYENLEQKHRDQNVPSAEAPNKETLQPEQRPGSLEALESETPGKKSRPNFKINWNHSRANSVRKSSNSESEPISYKVQPKKQQKPLVASNQKSPSSRNANFDMLETVIDAEGNFIYTKMKNNDTRVGKLLTELKTKKLQEDNSLILLEGKRLVKEALISNCALKYVLFSRKDDVNFIRPFLPKIGASLYKMPYQEMQLWSDLQTCPGIMGIFKRPDLEAFTPTESLPFTVICDNVREPGNLGAILRICAGVGCQKVILTKGCVNLWDSKVLRSSAGAHFKLNIQNKTEWSAIEEQYESDCNIYIADNKIISEVDADPETKVEDSMTNLDGILQNIPMVPYYGVNFKASKNIVLIVGGETCGISDRSYKLASRSNGVRLNIPLSNDIESLNVGAALGVIAFEVKKQLKQA